jgi:hypothetical protein
MNNPYTPGSPVPDARMFYGRTYELSEIGAFLRNAQSVSIIGPAGIGKTSLMQHLMRAEVKIALGIGAENLLVSIDCGQLESSRQDEIFAHFCARMAAALRIQGLEPEPALEDIASNPTWSTCELAVRKLNQRGLRVVLMLDDFEQLARNPHVDVRFYNGLRSAAGRLRLAFLTGSTRPLIELTCFDHSKKILSSPFFNIFAQLFLSLLSEPEARALIRRPMEVAGMVVSAQLEDFIYQLAGGHPYGLQTACSHASDNPDDLFKIKQQTRQDLEPFFQSIWQDLSPAEREALRDTAKASLEEASNPTLTVVLRDLTRKGVLIQAGGSFKYPSKAFAEFTSANRQAHISEVDLSL